MTETVPRTAVESSSATAPVAARGRHPIARYVARRLAAGVVTVFLVSVVVFAATEVLPGDVVSQVLGKDAPPGAVEVIRERLDLDGSPVERYVRWLGGMLTGDPGVSLSAATTTAFQGSAEDVGVSVWSLIGDRLANTAALALIATLVLIPLSLTLGLWMALHEGGFADRVVGYSCLIVSAIPEFVIATVLVMVFAVSLNLVPAVSLGDGSGHVWTDWRAMVLPVTAIVATMLAQTARIVRAGALHVTESDYVTTARLQGVRERTVVMRYVLPNALGPALQVYATSVSWMIGGIVVIEVVFQYPGIGSLLVNAVSTRDLPVIQALAMIIAVAYVVINLAADLISALLNPRLRSTM